MEHSVTTLLEKISSVENLDAAYRECARGKRGTAGYHKSVFNRGERLMRISRELKNGRYHWNGYRHFHVYDPKRRLVMAAPFMDRVVHHAIHRHIESILDPHLSDSVWACRHDRGNRAAVLAVLAYLKELGPKRFTMKLDVEKFYDTINIKILFEKIMAALPDQSLAPVLWSLLNSHPEYSKRGYGIPIGNLTSQLFANFYLASADRVALDLLKQGRLFRYMDDLVLIGPDKDEIMAASWAACRHCKDDLQIEIPFFKMVPLGTDPVPFLGFVVDHTGYRILARNKRRFAKKLRRLAAAKARPSHVAQVALSFEAWKVLPGENRVPFPALKKRAGKEEEETNA